MGDQLEDDFDADQGINNYAAYDDDDDDEDDAEEQSLADDSESEEDGGEGGGKEDQQKFLKKIKRKQKFTEMKLKKKQRLEEENNTLPSSSTSLSTSSSSPVGALSSEDQYRLCSTNCPPSPSFHFHLTPQNFLDLSSSSSSSKSQSSKKNSFVTAMEFGIPSFRQMIKATTTTGAPGAPTVVVICAAAKRAADVINFISKDVKCKIGKLFAKHFKVQDQVTALQQHFPIVVGTPHRLSKLMELGALTLTDTRLILIDLEMDAKAFSVLTLPGVCEDFYQLLCCPGVVEELRHLQFSLIRQSSEELEAMVAAEKKKKKGPLKKKNQSPKRVGFNKRKPSTTASSSGTS
jgi:hypothetical protein